MLLPVGDNLERPNLPLATVILIFINIAAFVVTSKMDLTGSHLVDAGDPSNAAHIQEVKEFYDVWGCVPAKLKEGQVIGLLTHMFLHADIFHLIGNMIILWVFGQSLETALGGFAFVTLYVFWGAVACVTHAAMDFQSEQFLIGASGAIAGVMGGYMTLFGFAAKIKIFMFIGPMPVTFFIPAGVFGFFWIMQQLYSASIDVEGALTGVAWMAHVGGFMGGLACMAIFRNQTDKVLVGDGERRFFVDREPQESGRTNSAQSESGEVDDGTDPARFVSRPCPYCQTSLDESHQIGDRLFRCPNSRCQQLSYLTDEDFQPQHS